MSLSICLSDCHFSLSLSLSLSVFLSPPDRRPHIRATLSTASSATTPPPPPPFLSLTCAPTAAVPFDAAICLHDSLFLPRYEPGVLIETSSTITMVNDNQSQLLGFPCRAQGESG